MSRMKNNVIEQVIAARETGLYTLPADLIVAHSACVRVRSLDLPAPSAMDAQSQGAVLLAACTSGADVDLREYASALLDADRDRLAVEKSRDVLRAAQEQAENHLAYLCSDLTERIITQHLRPSFEAMLEEVREIAAALGTTGLDSHSLLTAPPKARAAYLKLHELTARYQALVTARRQVNTVGDRRPTIDTNDIFAMFSDTMNLHPAWKSPAPVPRIPYPEDPIDLLLWLVGEASTAKPWMPTTADQDEAFTNSPVGVAAARFADGTRNARGMAEMFR